MPWKPEHIGGSGRQCEGIPKRQRFPDTGLLPHPVGLGDLRERHRDRYTEKNKNAQRRRDRVPRRKNKEF